MVVALLAGRQSLAGHCVTVAVTGASVPGYESYPEYFESLRRDGVAVVRLDSTFKRDVVLNVAAARNLAAALDRSSSPDVIHTHAAVPSLVGMLVSSRFGGRAPVLQTMHGWGTSKSPEQASTDLALMGFVDLVAVTSRTSMELLVGFGVAPENIRVIANGIPMLESERVSCCPREIAEARSDGARVLSCVGSVGHRKNQRLLVEALPLLDSCHEFQCLVIGEGEEIRELESLTADLRVGDRIRFLGRRDTAARYIEHSDLLILPSRSEGQPISVLEAFRAGIPVIGSDIPEIAELIEDGQTGFLFGSESPKSLAAAISRAISLPPSEIAAMGRLASRRFIASFTVERMVDDYMQLYLASRAAREVAA